MEVAFWRTALILCLGTLAVWSADRRPPVLQGNHIVVNDPVHSGGPLKIEHTVNRLRSCPRTLDEVFIDGDGQRTLYPETNAPIAPGPMGIDVIKEKTMVPDGAAPGQGHLRITLSYACNPIQMIFPVIVAYTVDFTIA